MNVINIISNPYKRTVEFKSFKEAAEEWIPVDAEHNPNSKLISEDIRSNFFPYKVNEIVATLLKDYQAGNEKLQIVFSGSADEFQEIYDVCESNDSVELTRDNIGLENARDILPEIIDIFNKIEPIVDSCINRDDVKAAIENDISKFLDASNDVIPICVMGNYSSGKSTFINALMGSEVLPSGDMPVTAKIYKIKQSSEREHASIEFEYNEIPVHIDISDENYTVECGAENDIVQELKSMNSEACESTAAKVNRCLESINKSRDGVSDLINLTVPFAEGPLSKSKNLFVIFDTPGSNSATHKDHFAILEGAMQNLSNGIPIYVAEYHTLDSCDNENLYEKIKSISQIDSRFAMIVVNKADSANIKEESFDENMQEMILSQAVPRNLYSGGIYFVSSIMGLGAKTDGMFVDDHAEEFFEDNERKYSDPESKRYKTLYKYNIMPGQIKKHVVGLSESADDKIFANSGLLALEHEIVNFAEKYSAYDKCKQSEKYIGNIIDATQEEIRIAAEEREAVKKQMEETLENDKRQLIKAVEDGSRTLRELFSNSYDEYMSGCYNDIQFSYEIDKIKEIERDILDRKRFENDFSEKKTNLKALGAAILENFNGLGEESLGSFVKSLSDDVQAAIEEGQLLSESWVESNKETAAELLRVMSADFNNRGNISTKLVDRTSRNYWEEKAEKIKEDLSDIVTNSTALDEDKKRELADIIISYRNVSFGMEHVFSEENFERKLRLLTGYVIHLNKVNIRKLTETYNRDYMSSIDNICFNIKHSHSESIEIWCSQLVEKIRSNIVDYSPELSAQAKKIAEETEKIEMLKEKKKCLEDYDNQVQALMDWKTLS